MHNRWNATTEMYMADILRSRQDKGSRDGADSALTEKDFPDRSVPSLPLFLKKTKKTIPQRKTEQLCGKLPESEMY